MLGQFQSDWFSIRTVGFSKLTITDNHIISIKKIKKLDSEINPYLIDSVEILAKQKKGNSLFVLTKDYIGNKTIQKFTFDSLCNCLKTGYIDLPRDTVSNTKQFQTYINQDTSNISFVNFHKLETIQRFQKMQNISEVSASVFAKILIQLNISTKEASEQLKKNGIIISPFGPLALIRGNVEAEAFILYNVSPFFTRAEFAEVKKKYASNEEVKKALEALEKK